MDVSNLYHTQRRVVKKETGEEVLSYTVFCTTPKGLTWDWNNALLPVEFEKGRDGTVTFEGFREVDEQGRDTAFDFEIRPGNGESYASVLFLGDARKNTITAQLDLTFVAEPDAHFIDVKTDYTTAYNAS